MQEARPETSLTPRAIRPRPLDAARLRVNRLSVAHRGLTGVFREICRIAARTLDVERVGIWLLVDRRTALRCMCLYEQATGQFSEGAVLRVDDFPVYFETLGIRRTLPAEDATLDPRTRDLLETYLVPLGITSMLDAQILLNGELQGVVCHEHTGEPREWSTEERDFAGSMADAVALKMKTAEVDKLEATVRGLEALPSALRQREWVALMAAGVAHDFRNLLTIVKGLAHEILADPDSRPAVARSINEILETVDRGVALTNRLLEVGRDQAHLPKVTDAGEQIARMLPMLEQGIGPAHQLEFHRGETAGRVLIDPTELERVMLNLVINARDAMEGGGPICISVRRADGAGSSHVLVSVADRGRGIPPEIQERIFDPFFTTKPRDRGTGLGLAIVKEAIERAGGRVEVRSEVDVGTTVNLLLPRVSGS